MCLVQRVQCISGTLCFDSSKFDSPFLSICSHDGIAIYFLVFLDDLIFTGTETTFAKKFLQDLCAVLSQEPWFLALFLGVEVISIKMNLFLTQKVYL